MNPKLKPLFDAYVAADSEARQIAAELIANDLRYRDAQVKADAAWEQYQAAAAAAEDHTIVIPDDMPPITFT